MSQFSGKCDLYDHIMMEKTYQHGNCLVSDELECFELFKQRTGGIIHQHYKITVSEWNQEYVKQHCPGFDYQEINAVVADNRCKNKERTVKSYEYLYYQKKYLLKELNKEGVYITVDIKFNTLLDIIPYYPYIVSMCCSDQGREVVYISRKPWPISEFEDSLRSGGTLSYPNWYHDQLQEHYVEVCHKYYLKDIDNRTKTISLFGVKPLHNGYYELLLPESADYMHPPKFIWADGKSHSHWTSPKISDTENYVILVSEQDVDGFLTSDIKNNTVMIQYVAKCDFPNEARDDKGE